MDTPKSCANRDCERPVRSRIVETEGTCTTRPCSPRLSCWRPSRISSPIWRFGLATDLLPDLPENVRRNRLLFVLGVEREHPDFVLLSLHVVDDPDATTFAAARDTPPELSDAAGPTNHVTSLWVGDQHSLQVSILIVGQVLRHQSREESRLDEREHHRYYTSLTYYVKDVYSRPVRRSLCARV